MLLSRRRFLIAPALDAEVRHLYKDAKICIRAELPTDFEGKVAPVVALTSRSPDREDYILHPPAGELLDATALAAIEALRLKQAGAVDVQLVISDGLDALSLTDEGHLAPYLTSLKSGLSAAGLRVADDTIVVTRGRVRASHRVGEQLVGRKRDPKRRVALLHLIGERPGNVHHTFSIYLTALAVAARAEGGVDHDITRVIAGVADTALKPEQAVADTVSILREMME